MYLYNLKLNICLDFFTRFQILSIILPDFKKGEHLCSPNAKTRPKKARDAFGSLANTYDGAFC